SAFPRRPVCGRDFKPLADFRQCGVGYAFPESNELGTAFEIVVAIAGDIGFDYEIGALLGLNTIHILRDGKALADDIENVFGTASFGPARSEERRVGKECRVRGW